MNLILERLYPNKTLLMRRQGAGLSPIAPCTDTFAAYLHEEMRQCFLNGHDHAALVTACALIDFAVKDAIEFDVYVKAGHVFNAVEWDQIDDLQFGDAINMAKRRGVITKDECKQLDWIREHIRNVYMHGQTPHWIKDKVDKIMVGNLETGDVKEQDVRVRDDIVLQRHVRIIADRNVCDRVVRLVDHFVRLLAERANLQCKDWKQKDASLPTMAQVERVHENMRKKGLKADIFVMNEWPHETPRPPAV